MKVNQPFRNWTRGLQFSLTMGRGQVATLVAIHAGQGERGGGFIGSSHPRLKMFVVLGGCLIDRGLVSHDKNGWHITEAGEHVVSLLKLSGVYQELETEFRAYEAGNRARWRRTA